MRIVSWNIRAGGGVRVDRIAEQLELWRPSVVALCEFRGTPPSRRLAERLAEMGLAHQRTTAAGDEPRKNALLIASRWPLRRLPIAAAPREQHRWLSVRVAAPEPLVLGALHVPNKATGRKYEFHQAVVSVAASWRHRPSIVVGDTNSGWPGLDEQVPCFGPGEKAFLDSFAALGWADAFRHLRGRERAYTWYSPNGGNGFRLDQGFLNRALLSRLEGASYAWGRGRKGGLSDHAALLIDLTPGRRPLARVGQPEGRA